jgi:antitoxin (DNA-binding transcriptional repressor) of toxin-antitoxin stability system
MIEIDIQQAQAELPRYVDEVVAGEVVYICRKGVAVAELRAVPVPTKEPRPLGLARGMGQLLPSFFDPLPADILDAFEGKSA